MKHILIKVLTTNEIKLVNNIVTNGAIKYPGDIDIYNIAKLLNISILSHTQSGQNMAKACKSRQNAQEIRI